MAFLMFANWAVVERASGSVFVRVYLVPLANSTGNCEIACMIKKKKNTKWGHRVSLNTSYLFLLIPGTP